MRVKFDLDTGLSINITAFEVVKYLGMGVFSFVYRVKNLSNEKFYAAKISRMDCFSNDKKPRNNNDKKLKQEFMK